MFNIVIYFYVECYVYMYMYRSNFDKGLLNLITLIQKPQNNCKNDVAMLQNGINCGQS